MSEQQTLAGHPGADAGKDREARDVRIAWWVYLAGNDGVYRWRHIVDVRFPRAGTGGGARRVLVCADGVEADLPARQVVRTLNERSLRRLGLDGVDPGALQ